MSMPHQQGRPARGARGGSLQAATLSASNQEFSPSTQMFKRYRMNAVILREFVCASLKSFAKSLSAIVEPSEGFARLQVASAARSSSGAAS